MRVYGNSQISPNKKCIFVKCPSVEKVGFKYKVTFFMYRLPRGMGAGGAQVYNVYTCVTTAGFQNTVYSDKDFEV